MPTCGNILQCTVLALLGLAMVMVNSAGMSLGTDQVTLKSMLYQNLSVYAILSLVIMMAVGHLDIRKFRHARGFWNPIPWLMLLAILLTIAPWVPGIGATINGSRRRIRLWGGLTFQPSELAKWTLVLAISWWAAHRAGAMKRFRSGLLPALIVVAVTCGLVIVEDLGTAVLIGTVAFILLLAAGARWWHLALFVPPALGGVVYMIMTNPYRLKRIISFLHPEADPEGAGYQLMQGLLAIVSGNRGVGNGLQKLGYLPTDTSDFLFAVICEEMGMGGAALVMLLYGAIIWVSVVMLGRCRHTFDRMLTLGIMSTIAIQALMNMLVVTGMVPTKGIPLPLLSAGGTGWLMTAAAVGLLVAVDRVQMWEAAEALEYDRAGNPYNPADVLDISTAEPAL